MYRWTHGCNQETIRCDLSRMYRSTIELHEKSQKFVFLRDKKVHFFGPRGNLGEILGDKSLARALRKISSRQI